MEPKRARAATHQSRQVSARFGQTDEILMPLTLRLPITLGPPNSTRAIPDHEVDEHNALQARLARDYLIPLSAKLP